MLECISLMVATRFEVKAVCNVPDIDAIIIGRFNSQSVG